MVFTFNAMAEMRIIDHPRFVGVEYREKRRAGY
jgi:hypothetical protein